MILGMSATVAIPRDQPATGRHTDALSRATNPMISWATILKPK